MLQLAPPRTTFGVRVYRKNGWPFIVATNWQTDWLTAAMEANLVSHKVTVLIDILFHENSLQFSYHTHSLACKNSTGRGQMTAWTEKPYIEFHRFLFSQCCCYASCLKLPTCNLQPATRRRRLIWKLSKCSRYEMLIRWEFAHYHHQHQHHLLPTIHSWRLDTKLDWYGNNSSNNNCKSCRFCWLIFAQCLASVTSFALCTPGLSFAAYSLQVASCKLVFVVCVCDLDWWIAWLLMLHYHINL